MHRRIAVLTMLLAAFALPGCAVRAAGEDLGGGFRRVPAAGEARDHLYFKGSDLGATPFISVAPSGRHAIFARGSDLFRIASEGGKLDRVTDGEFSMPREVVWHEDERYAEVRYEDGRAPSRVPLE